VSKNALIFWFCCIEADGIYLLLRTSFKLALENISKVTVSYLRLSIAESYASDAIKEPTDGVEPAEVVYERDVHRHSIRAFWLTSWGAGQVKPNFNKQAGELAGSLDSSVQRAVGGKIRDTVIERLDCTLKPGEKLELEVGVYGKKWW
jgi:hypothetical protein